MVRVYQDSFYRLKQIIGDKNKDILPIVPVSQSTWWLGVKSGKFPKPIKLSEGVTVWRGGDLLELLNRKDSYTPPTQKRVQPFVYVRFKESACERKRFATRFIWCKVWKGATADSFPLEGVSAYLCMNHLFIDDMTRGMFLLSISLPADCFENPMTKRVERKLKKIAKSLNKASQTHKGQAREITKIVKKKAKTRRRK